MEQNKDFASGRCSGPNAKDLYRKHWVQVASLVSKCGPEKSVLQCKTVRT